MTAEELKNVAVAKSVDARGTACPGPLLEAKKAIGTIKAGEILEVLSADEGTKSDIPKWCSKQGHEYLGAIDENGYFKVYLKKK
jgi:TusA-related sulfurtransferase